MPRYFFNFSDGKRCFTDDKGHDLSGLGAVRSHAVAQVREIKAMMCDSGIQDLSGWSMQVTDSDGRTVFELGFDLKPHRSWA